MVEEDRVLTTGGRSAGAAEKEQSTTLSAALQIRGGVHGLKHVAHAVAGLGAERHAGTAHRVQRRVDGGDLRRWRPAVGSAKSRALNQRRCDSQ